LQEAGQEVVLFLESLCEGPLLVRWPEEGVGSGEGTGEATVPAVLAGLVFLFGDDFEAFLGAAEGGLGKAGVASTPSKVVAGHRTIAQLLLDEVAGAGEGLAECQAPAQNQVVGRGVHRAGPVKEGMTLFVGGDAKAQRRGWGDQVAFGTGQDVEILVGGVRANQEGHAGDADESDGAEAAVDGAGAGPALGQVADQEDGNVQIGGEAGQRDQGAADHLVVEG
jgi:hypothetical protein